MSDNPPFYPRNIAELDDAISQPDEDLITRLRQLDGDCMVLGAGGKMGFHLSRMLQKVIVHHGAKSRVIAVSRFTNSEARARFEEHGIPTIAADLSDPQAIKSLPHANHVFFLAGVKFGTSNDPDLLRRMNQEMPLYVANHFSGSRIVAMSTGCVYSFSEAQSGGSLETDQLDPPGDYARSCIAREQAFQQQSLQTGTPVAIVRLNYSVEPRYGVLVDIAKAIRKEVSIDLTTGFVNVIWQRDAISQILQCLMLADSPAWIVNITGDETLSVRKIAERFAEKMHKPVSFVGSESSHCWLSNNRQARMHFGESQMPLERMMDWIVDWLSREMPTLSKPTHFQTRDGNY